MKLFASLLLLASPAICFASEKPIAEDFFAYPKTKITLTVGDVSSHSISSENYGRQTEPVIGEWTFRNGLGHVVEERELGEVTWEFVKRTQYGDVYVFSMKSKRGKEKTTAVIFDGEPILMEFENTKFFIQLDGEST